MVREVVRPRRARGRAVRDDVAVALDLVGGGHAATSSSCSAASSASFSASLSTASESAGGSLGQVGQDEPVVGPEGRRRDLEDRLRRHRQVARQHLVDEAGLVEQRRVHRQPVGALLDALEGAELVRLDQGEGAGQLVLADGLRREALDLLVQRGLDALDRDARADRGPAGLDRGAADEPEREQRDVLGDPLVPDEAAVQPAALAAGEDLAGDLERVQPAIAVDRGAEPDVDARQRDLVVDGLADLGAERRRQRQVAERRDVRVGRDGPEVALGAGSDGRGVHVADDRDDRVVRRVVGAEEVADVLERGGVEIRHRPDRRVVVGMLLRVEVRLELFLPRAVWPVVVRPALLVLDDLALVVEVLLAERLEERRHAVGFEPQRQVELVGRHRLEVVRPIEPGRAVHRAAGRLDEGDVLGLGDVLGALEHHVLEQVGEARLARLFVLGADVVPDVDRDDGGEVVLGDDQAQAVGEALVGEGHGRDGQRGSRHARLLGCGRGRRVGRIFSRVWSIVPRRIGPGPRGLGTPRPVASGRSHRTRSPYRVSLPGGGLDYVPKESKRCR